LIWYRLSSTKAGCADVHTLRALAPTTTHTQYDRDSLVESLFSNTVIVF